MVSFLSVPVVGATIFGSVFSIFGTFMYIAWPSIFDSILSSKLILSPGSASYDLWEVTPIPMYIEFYLFNWTNPEDINNPNKTIARPKLVELGPYVFREHRRKVIKGWNNENSTITFLQNRTWHFEPDKSNGNLSDLITTVNVPAVTATYAMRNAAFPFRMALALAIGALKTQVHVTKTAGEFLFDGYSDPLLNLASFVPASVVPVQIPFDKFGWFYSRNGSATYDGVFNMFTGASDITKFGQIGEWDYMNKTHFYESTCGMVNGSAGEFFSPYQDKSNISLFSSDVCRTLTLSYKGPTEMDGIPGYRYWGDETMFDNKTSKADNWCFCPSGNCPPSGAIDVSSCKFGAPAFISFPHFYHADPSYREAVDGMHPDPRIHELYIDIEPRSGIPLQVSAAMQINILLQPHSEYTFLKHVPKIYFPCIWFRQTAQIDETIGPTVRLVAKLPAIGSIISLVILSTGLSTIAILAICLVTRVCRKDEESVILGPSNPIPVAPSSGYHSRSMTSASKLRSVKSFLHAYLWRQKVLPEETIISPQNMANNRGFDYNGKTHAVVISPLTLSSDFPHDSAAASLVQSTMRSRRSSQVSNKGDGSNEITPLFMEQDLKAAVAAYM